MRLFFRDHVPSEARLLTFIQGIEKKEKSLDETDQKQKCATEGKEDKILKTFQTTSDADAGKEFEERGQLIRPAFKDASHGADDKRVRAKSGFFQKMLEAEGCVAKKIVRDLMLVMEEGDTQEKTSIRFQYATQLAQRFLGLIQMLQNLGAEYGIERSVSDRQTIERGDDIQMGIVPGAVAHTDINSNIVAVLEKGLIGALTGTGIQYATFRLKTGGGFGDKFPDRKCPKIF